MNQLQSDPDFTLNEATVTTLYASTQLPLRCSVTGTLLATGLFTLTKIAIVVAKCLGA